MTSTTSLVPAPEASENTLIKTDGLGRMRRTREQRERILDEFERSGVSGARFAGLCGVKYQTFCFWVQKRRQERARSSEPERSKTVQWLEAQLQPGSGAGLVVHLPGGARVEIADPQHVNLAAALVRALEKPC